MISQEVIHIEIYFIFIPQDFCQLNSDMHLHLDWYSTHSFLRHKNVRDWYDWRNADAFSFKVNYLPYQEVNFIVENSHDWHTNYCSTCLQRINLLRPSFAICRHRTWSTMVQEMACCLTVPSHYLNQCSPIISEVLRHSPEGDFTGNAQDIYPCYKFGKN